LVPPRSLSPPAAARVTTVSARTSRNLEAAADNTANAAEAAALENQADALKEEGEDKEKAIDKSDVNAAAVNAM
jgi:hypothetical protein